MTLLPQFRDAQTCRRCGAPCEIIGHPYQRHMAGEVVLDFDAQPVLMRRIFDDGLNDSRPVRDSDAGAVRVEGPPKEDGERMKQGRAYWAIPVTHLCTGCDTALPGCMTTSVPADEMPADCHVRKETL